MHLFSPPTLSFVRTNQEPLDGAQKKIAAILKDDKGNDDQYYVKFMVGEKLFLEVMGHYLCRILNLPTPQIGILKITPSLLSYVPQHQEFITDLQNDGIEFAFASQYIPQSTPLSSERIPIGIEGLCFQVMLFDYVFGHFDRSLKNPNLLRYKKSLQVIDHDLLFIAQIWYGWKKLPYDRCAEKLRDHVLFRALKKNKKVQNLPSEIWADYKGLDAPTIKALLSNNPFSLHFEELQQLEEYLLGLPKLVQAYAPELKEVLK